MNEPHRAASASDDRPDRIGVAAQEVDDHAGVQDRLGGAIEGRVEEAAERGARRPVARASAPSTASSSEPATRTTAPGQELPVGDQPGGHRDDHEADDGDPCWG